jgi:hypothetical protein
MPTEYRTFIWEDILACGHTLTVETAVPVDRASRVGSIAICPRCMNEGRTGAARLQEITATKYLGEE